jgi:hypothetical protein
MGAIGFSDERLEEQGGNPLRADRSKPVTTSPQAATSRGIEPKTEALLGEFENADTTDLSLTYPPTRPLDEQFYNLLLETGIAPLRAKAQVHHRRILPALLQDHPREWAAYHGDRLLGIGKSRASLYRACLSRGLGVDEVLVLGIAPEGPAEIDYPFPS